MVGTESQNGIMLLTLQELFNRISDRTGTKAGDIGGSVESSFEVSLTYIEIYNENIRDLLSDRTEFLELREDRGGGVQVAGITVVKVESAGEVLEYLSRGNKFRTSEATGANEVSSRSHAVLQVCVGHKTSSLSGHYTQKFGKLSMIDLAGSGKKILTTFLI